MKRTPTPTRSIATFFVLYLSASALPAGLASSAVPQSVLDSDRDVIVILRDQLPNMPPVRGTREARAAAIASAQVPIVSELQQAGARKVRSFRLINAIAATVSRAEADHLATHQLVQAVVDDLTIRAPKRTPVTAPLGISAGSANAASTSADATLSTGANRLCNTLEPEALQLTNAAFSNPSAPQAQLVLDGNGWPVIGRGVTVAFLADGLDRRCRASCARMAAVYSSTIKISLAIRPARSLPASRPSAMRVRSPLRTTRTARR